MTRARRFLALLALAPALLLTSAHIGDNNTHFRGPAGPYTVQVVVRHPGVVPGLAEITVRVEDADVHRVLVRPVRWDVGLDGSPRPDPATAVPGEPRLFAAELWFMTPGSYSIYVDVEGDAGTGTAIVPVTSLATRELAMGPGLGIVLVLLALLLITGLVTIVGAAVREAVLPPGMPATAARRRRSRWAAAVALAVIALGVTGGRFWWQAEAAAYRAGLHEPLALDTQVRQEGGRATLRLTLVDPRWLEKQFTPLVPDHGKLMHAFLVRTPDLDAFAHVHPEVLHPDSFRLLLPPLPAGTYRLYADVVHETGLAQTLTDTLTLPALAFAQEPGPDSASVDDAWWTGQPQAAEASAGGTLGVVFPDGSALVWVREASPITAGQALELHFALRQPDGSPAMLEPYMGMLAHAVVTRRDGGVFVHLHPSGSISMAAQEAVLRAEPQPPRVAIGSIEAPVGIDVAALPDDTTPPPPTTEHTAHAPPPDTTVVPATAEVVIPYAFPTPGDYRLWVQVRRGGLIWTAPFDLRVVAGR